MLLAVVFIAFTVLLIWVMLATNVAFTIFSFVAVGLLFLVVVARGAKR